MGALDSLAFWKIIKQDVMHVSETRDITFKKMVNQDGCLQDKENGRSWFDVHSLMLASGGQLPLRLIITDRDSIPKDPFRALKKEDIEELIDHKTIARNALRSTMAKSSVQQSNKMMVYAVSLCVGVVALAFLILVAFAVAQHTDFGQVWQNITKGTGFGK